MDESSEGYEEHNTDWSASILWSYNLDQENRKKQYRSLLQSWTIQFKWIPEIYVQSLALVLAVGLAAGVYPAWRALQYNLAAILKEE